MEREAVVLDGRFIAFARLHAGERLWVTYYQRNYGNRVDPSPAPVYQNETGIVSSMAHVNFDTINQEVKDKAGRLGPTSITLTQIMFPIWLSKGFELLSKEDVQALTSGKERKGSRATDDPNLKPAPQLQKKPPTSRPTARSRAETRFPPLSPPKTRPRPSAPSRTPQSPWTNSPFTTSKLRRRRRRLTSLGICQRL